jgi:CRP-like cAMP-binding protein
MVSTDELRIAIAGHALLGDLQPHHIAMLAALAHRTQFLPGDIIFREGEHGNWFYFLISGEVELELTASGQPLPVQELRFGQEFGWSSLFEESKGFEKSTRHFTARALTRVDALAFDGSELRLAFRQDPEFGYRFMRRLLAVATERLDAARLELSRCNQLKTNTPAPN